MRFIIFKIAEFLICKIGKAAVVGVDTEGDKRYMLIYGKPADCMNIICAQTENFAKCINQPTDELCDEIKKCLKRNEKL